MKNIILIILLLLPKPGATREKQASENDRVRKRIVEEHFEYPDGKLPDAWWNEGIGAVIKNGRLYVDAKHGVSTVWLDKEFSGDLRIEYDAHIISSERNINNINCFFMFSDTTGIPLRKTSQLRKNGDYKLYHGYNGYIFTFVNDPKKTDRSRFRLRDCPGFHLIGEKYADESKAGKTYHIIIEKTDSRIRIYVDDILIMDKTDDEYNPVHQNGLFGFRTYHTELWWDNLVVTAF